MLQVATTVHREGYCTLSEAYGVVSPGIKYTAQHARNKLLQMPLACLRVDFKPGVSKCFLVEHSSSVNYCSIIALLKSIVEKQQPQSVPSLDKATVKSLLGLCQSDRERECVRYAVFKASGVSCTQARKQFGFHNMLDRATKVEKCIAHIEYISKAVDKLAMLKEKSVLLSLGIPPDSDDSSSADDSDASIDGDMVEAGCPWLCPSQACSLEWTELLPKLTEVVRQSDFNWFEVTSRVETLVGLDNTDSVIAQLSSSIDQLEIEKKEKEILQISYEAFLAEEYNNSLRVRHVDALNGCIVTDSESDDPDKLQEAQSPLDTSLMHVIKARRAAIKRQVRRLKAKHIEEKHFLQRRKSKRVRGIIKDFPKIGETIEDFVKSCNVGADAWRRTGVLTFDGNSNVKQKVTYERIRQHLVSHYGRRFSYGTVVQLCVARNRRHKSAMRYKGVAQVTSRRARRGFEIRYNPDSHWSGAFYRGLDYLQYTDGKNILNVNRDDASGFRLDTLATHKQYATPTVQGHNVLTTHTDYVKKYPTTLQVTSYNFSKTKTTPELCCGIVKAVPVFPKSPAQHAADFKMLQEQPKLQPIYVHPVTGDTKKVLCVRVDGASDEGPSHEEVQYWWTLEHLQMGRLATLVTARSSGASFLNRVELQNGCLSRGHSNLFIPSTLAGSCTESGEVNQEILKQSLNLAIDVYIKYVDQSPCGETTINLFRGADASSDHHSMREYLKVFLKGSKKNKRKLKQEHPQVYKQINEIMDLRGRHQMTGYPSQYIFYLLCCFKGDCIHPLCRENVGKSQKDFSWFPGGPPLTYLPVPVPDPERPWGNSSCKQCSGFCSGHFLVPNSALGSLEIPMAVPPSGMIQQAYKSSITQSDVDLSELAQKVLLPVDEVKIWVSHLETINKNRKRGAQKAAATRRARNLRSDFSADVDTYCCDVCKETYEEETDEIQNWIGCDLCSKWFHWDCIGVIIEPESFVCCSCQCE